MPGGTPESSEQQPPMRTASAEQTISALNLSFHHQGKMQNKMSVPASGH